MNSTTLPSNNNQNNGSATAGCPTGLGRSVLGMLRRKLWFLFLAFIALFFTMPINLAISLQTALRQESRGNIGRVADSAADFFGPGNISLPIMLLLVSFAAGLALFSFLHDRRQVDFFHSQPKTRGRLFAETCLAALACVVLPYLLNLLLSLIVLFGLGAGGAFAPGLTIETFLLNLVFILAVLALLALAAIISGNTPVQALFSVILLTLGPACVGLYRWVRDALQPAWFGRLTDWDLLIGRSSPAARWLMLDTYSGGQPLAGWELGLLIAFAAVVLGLGLLIYRRRPSEAAGHALSFPASRPWIKYPICLLATATMAMLLHEIGDSFSGDFAWYFIGAALGCFLSAQLMEIVYHADFRAISRKLWAMLLTLVLFCGGSGLLLLDPMGYNTYLPADEEGLTLEVSFNNLGNVARNDNYLVGNYREPSSLLLSENEWLALGYVSDPAAVSAVHAMVERMIASYQADDEARPDEYYDHNYTTAVVRWLLPDGSVKVREYLGGVDLCQITAEYDALLADEDYRRRMLPLINYDPQQLLLASAHSYNDLDRHEFYLPGSVYSINYKDNNAAVYEYSPAPDVSDLLATYQQEYLAMDGPARRQMQAIGTLEFHVYEDAAQRNAATDNSYLVCTVPVTAAMSRTLAQLDAMGVELEWELDLSRITKAEVFDHNWEREQKRYGALLPAAKETMPTSAGNQDGVTISTTDPAEIAELVAQTLPGEGQRYNPFLEITGALELRLYYSDQYGNTLSTWRNFPRQN